MSHEERYGQFYSASGQGEGHNMFPMFGTFFSILACYYNMCATLLSELMGKQTIDLKESFDKRIFIVIEKHCTIEIA